MYAHDAGSRASHDDNGVQADELHAIRKMPSQRNRLFLYGIGH